MNKITADKKTQKIYFSIVQQFVEENFSKLDGMVVPETKEENSDVIDSIDTKNKIEDVRKMNHNLSNLRKM